MDSFSLLLADAKEYSNIIEYLSDEKKQREINKIDVCIIIICDISLC